LLESWHTKQAPLVEIMKSLLEQQSLGIRMALAEVMHSTQTFGGDSHFYLHESELHHTILITAKFFLNA